MILCKTIFSLGDLYYFASDNSRFRKKILKRLLKIAMTINDKIKDEKIQYNINREAAKISALSSGKIYNMNFLQVKK